MQNKRKAEENIDTDPTKKARTESLDQKETKDTVKPEEKPSGLPSLISIVRDPELKDQRKIEIISERLKIQKNCLDETDDDGATLLHEACFNGGVELVDWLLNQKKELLSSKTSYGTNVLFYAAKYANKAVVNYLCDRFPELAKDINNVNRTVLHFAALSGNKDIFTRLFELQQKPLAKEFFQENEDSILWYAMDSENLDFLKWLASNHHEFMMSFESVKVCVDRTDTEHTKKTEISTWLEATFLNSEAWVDALINNGLQNKLYPTGYYTIHAVIQEGHVRNVAKLMDKYNISPNLISTNELKSSLLDIAIKCGHIDIVKLLIERGADLNVRNGVGVYSLHLAAACGHIEIVKLLIERGADLNLTNGDGEYPLHTAATWGRIEIVKLLLTHKVPINQLSTDSYRETAMHCAARSGHVEIVELLHKEGCEINQPNAKSWFPIHYAAKHNHPDMVEWFINHGVSPDQMDTKGTVTPLYLALEHGKLKVYPVLCKYKAKYTVPSETISMQVDREIKSPGKENKTPPAKDRVEPSSKNNLPGKLLLAATKYPEALPVLMNVLAEDVYVDTLADPTRDGANPIIPAAEIKYTVTALHEAVRHHNIEAVKYLLQKDAKLDDEARGALVLAMIGGNTEIFELLFSKAVQVPNAKHDFLEHGARGAFEFPAEWDIEGAYRKTWFYLENKLDYVFKKPLLKLIYNILIKYLSVTELRDFERKYLCNLMMGADEKVITTFVELIKHKMDDFLNYIFYMSHWFVNYSFEGSRVIFENIAFLLRHVIDHEQFFQRLSANDHAFLRWLVKAGSKTCVEMILNHRLFKKDLSLIQQLLDGANEAIKVVIIESISPEQRSLLRQVVQTLSLAPPVSMSASVARAFIPGQTQMSSSGPMDLVDLTDEKSSSSSNGRRESKRDRQPRNTLHMMGQFSATYHLDKKPKANASTAKAAKRQAPDAFSRTVESIERKSLEGNGSSSSSHSAASSSSMGFFPMEIDSSSEQSTSSHSLSHISFPSHPKTPSPLNPSKEDDSRPSMDKEIKVKTELQDPRTEPKNKTGIDKWIGIPRKPQGRPSQYPVVKIEPVGEEKPKVPLTEEQILGEVKIVRGTSKALRNCSKLSDALCTFAETRESNGKPTNPRPSTLGDAEFSGTISSISYGKKKTKIYQYTKATGKRHYDEEGFFSANGSSSTKGISSHNPPGKLPLEINKVVYIDKLLNVEEYDKTPFHFETIETDLKKQAGNNTIWGTIGFAGTGYTEEAVKSQALGHEIFFYATDEGVFYVDCHEYDGTKDEGKPLWKEMSKGPFRFAKQTETAGPDIYGDYCFVTFRGYEPNKNAKPKMRPVVDRDAYMKSPTASSSFSFRM